MFYVMPVCPVSSGRMNLVASTFDWCQKVKVEDDETTVRRADDEQWVASHRQSSWHGADLQQVSEFVRRHVVIARDHLQWTVDWRLKMANGA